MTAAKAMFLPLTLVGNRALALSVLRGSIRTVSTCTRHQLSTGIGRSLFTGRMKTILPVAATSALPVTVRSRRTFCARATTESEDSAAASIESSLMQSMEKKIKEQLNAESVVVKDAYGDGRHVSIDVISAAFEGQSAVNRQRMVYKAIWEELQDTVHAVDQMTTKTPSEAGK